MKKLSSFFSGVLATLLVMSLIGESSAYTGTVTKELIYKNISVTLDGEKLDLRTAKGNPVEPFMFGGTNYLPVRALSEALGLNVSWDGKTNTVVLRTERAQQQLESYKALAKWIANNHTMLTDGILSYSAVSASGNGVYVVARDIPGTITLMRELNKNGGKFQMIITLSEDGKTHSFDYYFTPNISDEPSVVGVGSIDAEKFSEKDGFLFSAENANGTELKLHEEIARYSALDALSFLDDVFVNRMKSLEYNISTLGFVRDNIV